MSIPERFWSFVMGKRIKVADEDMFNAANCLLLEAFHDRYVEDLYEWMWGREYSKIKRHIAQVAAKKRYSKEVVEGVHVAVLMAATFFLGGVEGTTMAFRMGETFNEATKYITGEAPRMLSKLRKMNAKLPAWLVRC